MTPLPAATADHSRYVQRIRRRYTGHMACLSAGAPDRQAMEAAYAHLRALGLEVGAALRIVHADMGEASNARNVRRGADEDIGARNLYADRHFVGAWDDGGLLCLNDLLLLFSFDTVGGASYSVAEVVQRLQPRCC